MLRESSYKAEMIIKIWIILNNLEALPTQDQSPLKGISHIENEMVSIIFNRRVNFLVKNFFYRTF